MRIQDKKLYGVIIAKYLTHLNSTLDLSLNREKRRVISKFCRRHHALTVWAGSLGRPAVDYVPLGRLGPPVLGQPAVAPGRFTGQQPASRWAGLLLTMRLGRARPALPGPLAPAWAASAGAVRWAG